ncbi:MAG: SDR family NAD(P)-dependent oxidoreductase [Pseudomonadota bacterium]
MSHRALTQGNVAVITGGAAGIGLALAEDFAAAGLRIALLDRTQDALDSAVARLGEMTEALGILTDVSQPSTLAAAAAQVTERWGGTDILVANAGIQTGSTVLGDGPAWDNVLAVNLRGVIDTVRAFGPGMVARGRDGAIICTGSKQGITTPPGDPAYNVAKAGVKAFTEALAHELRTTKDCRITAHLLIPGFVFTGLTSRGRTEKPDGAWTPEQMATFAVERLHAGDFYILCPDNDVTRELDEKRMAWAIGDIIENRPALSRWHPDYADAFQRFVSG